MKTKQIFVDKNKIYLLVGKLDNQNTYRRSWVRAARGGWCCARRFVVGPEGRTHVHIEALTTGNNQRCSKRVLMVAEDQSNCCLICSYPLPRTPRMLYDMIRYFICRKTRLYPPQLGRLSTTGCPLKCLWNGLPRNGYNQYWLEAWGVTGCR